MPDETWKRIPASRLLGVRAGYQASGDGDVRSVPRTLADGRPAGGKVLAQQLDDDGYPTVKVAGKRVRVAILVQLAWAGLPQVMHLDDDRRNSRPENLAWGSKVVNEGMKNGTERRKTGSGRCVPPSRIETPGTAELH